MSHDRDSTWLLQAGNNESSDVGVVGPDLDGEFTRRLDEVGELLGSGGGALGLAAHLHVDADR